MGTKTIEPAPPIGIPTAAAEEWSRYSLAMRQLAQLELDPNATPQQRADAALAAHHAWRDFLTAMTPAERRAS